MLRRLTLIVSFLMTFALASSAAAQGDMAPLNLSEMDGVETGYARMYMIDIEAALEDPANMDAATPEDAPFYGIAIAIDFDDEDSAEAGFETFSDEFSSAFFEGDGPESNEIDDLGDNAVEMTGEVDVDDSGNAPTGLVMVQEGEMIYVSVIMGGDDATGLAMGLAEFMLDGEPGEGDVELVPDGNSSGGVFDVMPTADDADVVDGLVPFMDVDLVSGPSLELE
ncbi:MAG TPA: hypothetical protein VKZ61_07075 [Thermomicrobiales bacterium]|nr:hypothetical protein [Thermomicrobiales bacterium]